MSKSDIVIDIGSKFLGLALVSRDFVLREPSVVAEQKLNKDVYVASGLKALTVAEEEASFVQLVYPIQDGAVTNASAFKYLVSNAMQKILPSRAFVSEINVWCVIKCGLDNENKRVIDVCLNELGVKKVYFVPSAVADACAAKQQFGINSCITVNMGNSVSEVCAVAENKMLAGASMMWAGSKLDQQICEFVLAKYGVKISLADAKALKQNCCSLYPNNMSVFKFKGVNVAKNEEQILELSSRELYETLVKFFLIITSVVNSLFLSVPVDAAELLRQNGIVLCGGLSGIDGLEKFFFDTLKVPVRCLDDVDSTGVNGAKVFAQK